MGLMDDGVQAIFYVSMKRFYMINHKVPELDDALRTTGELIDCEHGVWDVRSFEKNKPANVTELAWQNTPLKDKFIRIHTTKCPMRPLLYIAAESAKSAWRFRAATEYVQSLLEHDTPLIQVPSTVFCWNCLAPSILTPDTEWGDYCDHCNAYLWK